MDQSFINYYLSLLDIQFSGCYIAMNSINMISIMYKINCKQLFVPLLFMYLLIISDTVGASTPDQVVLTNWEYAISNDIPDSTAWKQMPDMQEMSSLCQDHTIWLRTVLPELSVRHLSLYIKRIRQPIQIFLDGEEIFQAGKTDEQQGFHFVRWDNLLVQLPDYNTGTSLIFKLYPVENVSGFSWSIVLVPDHIIYKKFLLQNIDDIAFAIIFLATGLAVLLLFFISRRSKLLLGIIIYLFSLVIFIASNSSFIQLLLPAPGLYYHLDYISLISATIGAFFAIEQIIEYQYKKVLKGIWILHLLFLFFSIMLLNLTNLTFPQLVNYFMVMLVVNMIICITVMVQSAKTGEYTAKLLFGGMVFFLVSAIVEIVLFYYDGKPGVYSYSVQAIHIGALFFVVSLIWIAIYLYLDTYKEKEIAQQKELDAVKKGNKASEQFAMRLIESQENERNRIAMELHDSVGQKLLIIKNLLLSELRKITSNNSPLEQVCDISGETIQDVRNIIYNLRPQHLDQLGLTTAIETVIENFADSSTITFQEELDDIDDVMSKEDEINFYRIIQESLNNIVKHSKADKAFITIKRIKDNINLVIMDNGIGCKGYDTSENLGKRGFGITGMYERARIIGAEMKMGPAENGGTIIELNMNRIKDE